MLFAAVIIVGDKEAFGSSHKVLLCYAVFFCARNN